MIHPSGSTSVYRGTSQWDQPQREGRQQTQRGCLGCPLCPTRLFMILKDNLPSFFPLGKSLNCNKIREEKEFSPNYKHLYDLYRVALEECFHLGPRLFSDWRNCNLIPYLFGGNKNTSTPYRTHCQILIILVIKPVWLYDWHARDFFG